MLSGKQLIGVDIGSSSVKLVELKAKKKGYAVKCVVEIPLTPDVIVDGSIMDYGEVAGTVSTAYKAAKFSSKNVAAGLKGAAVVVKKVSVPVTSKADLQETFLWEAEQYIDMDIEEVSLDYQVLGVDEAKGETELVIAGARKELIVDFKSVLEAARLKPIVMDLEVFAMINALNAEHEVSDEPFLVVNIGHSSTLILVMRKGRYELSTEISIGGKTLLENLGQKLSITFAEAEKRLLNTSNFEEDKDLVQLVDFFNSQIASEVLKIVNKVEESGLERPKECFICGGSAVLSGLREKIAESIEADVAIFDPFAGIDVAGTADKRLINEKPHSFTVALGLALRGAG